MLPRILEPEVMDTPEEALAYDSMDHSAVNALFVEDLLAAAARTGAPLEGELEVLDLGTGTAQIPIRLCESTAEVRIMAVDLSVSMLDLARCNAEVAGVRHRILFDRADAKALPYDNDRFDAVVSNSIVHHIPEPLAVLKEGWRVLRRGGLMFVRDLLRPADEEQLQHLVATYAGDATDHQRQLFAHSLRAALTLDEVRELVGQLPCEPAGVTQTSDRHWTWAARK